MNFTLEQLKFIQYPTLESIKLLACAGSGKTTCILARCKYMVEQDLVKKNQIMILTFSKSTQIDIQERVKKYPDYSKWINLTLIKTIDALAYQVMQKESENIVQSKALYSAWLAQFLSLRISKEEFKSNLFTDLKVLFVDEAQDLNPIQNQIIEELTRLLGLTVYMVGDPNQSIYAFRQSSPQYMLDFPGESMHLTLNFRSTPHIINFCEYLKPLPQKPSTSGKNSWSDVFTRPWIIYEKFDYFTEIFLKVLGKVEPEQWHEIAILCPTRGNKSKDHIFGLARVANWLHEQNIPFVQQYQEVGGQVDDASTNYKTEVGKINLLTFHGAKGREWNIVFCLDVRFNLMGFKPTAKLHQEYQYLLYVACSRARHYLFIFCDDKIGHDTIQLNHWLAKVPVEYYQGKTQFEPLKFTKDWTSSFTGIKDAIYQIKDFALLELAEKIKPNITIEQKYPSYLKILDDLGNDQVLWGTFLENLFVYQCHQVKKLKLPALIWLENILNQNVIFPNRKDYKLVDRVWKQCKTFINFKYAPLSEHERNIMHKYFPNQASWENNIICRPDFFHLIMENKSHLMEAYQNYQQALTWEKILWSLYYITLCQYCLDTNHYYHLQNRGQGKEYLLQYTDLFQHMFQVAQELNHHDTNLPWEFQISLHVPYLNLIGIADMMINGRLLELKATSEINNIRHLLQLLAYHYAKFPHINQFNQPAYLFNFITGEWLTVEFKPTHVMPLVRTLSIASNQPIKELKLVYDLETTGLLNEHIQPDIIQISIIEYAGEFPLLKNQHIQLENDILSPEITQLTGISWQHLVSGWTLEKLRIKINAWLERMDDSCTWLAHNGNKFDHILMRKKNIFLNNTLDTIAIIKLYGPKLDSYNLGHVYQALFKTPLKNAHSSWGDVQGLVQILRHLNYN